MKKKKTNKRSQVVAEQLMRNDYSISLLLMVMNWN